MAKLNRSQLLGQAVSGADDFTALRYLRLREDTPRLPQLEESGAQSLPNAQGALFDLYNSLWAPDPSVKSEEETPAALRYWRQMLESAVSTTAFEQMHAQTQLQELNSLIGTISMGQSILEMVPKEDREQLQQMAEAQAQADAAQQQMQQAQAQADAAGDMLAQIQRVMNGQPMSAAAQQAIADAQSQQQQSQAQAQAAQMTLAEAQAKAEALNQQLMGEAGTPQAQQKQLDMTRIAQQAATNAAKEVGEVSDLLQSWGIDPGELSRQGMPKALDIVKRIRNSKEFKKFKDFLGRLRHITERKAKSLAKAEGRFVPKVEYGRDILRADSSEIVNLMHPALRTQTLTRWMRGELRLIGRQWKKSMGKGPVVICEDGSGSMEGEKKIYSKALCLALAYFCRLEQRTFIWIHFGSKTSRLVVRVFKNGQMTVEQMLEISETFLSSGTDFEVPLSKALELIESENLPKADIVLDTDGECAVTAEWLKNFLTKKKALEVNVITILMDVGQSSIATVKQFSDRVETVTSFTAEEAGQKVIAHLI